MSTFHVTQLPFPRSSSSSSSSSYDDDDESQEVSENSLEKYINPLLIDLTS